MRTRWAWVVALLAVLGGCKRGGGDVVAITGAGASFPFPLYTKWFSEYQRIDPNVQINYQSIGSGGGIKQVTERTVDFGATDPPMKDEELAQVQGTLVHLPMTVGAVVAVYNLPSGGSELKLDGETLAAIFLGEIGTWDDPRIVAVNGSAPGAGPLTVVHRSDGSGTSAVFTEYLAAVSPAWAEKVGAGKSVAWPTGLGAKGNEGVAGQVKSTPGAIGYVELAYAIQTGLPYAAIRNRSGSFVVPSIESTTAAAAGVVLPEDLRVSIVNADGPQAYPIAAFTYLLVYEDTADARKGEALAKFLWWAIHEGQQFGPPLHYAPLPEPVVRQVEGKLRTLRSGDRVFLAGR